MHKAKSKHLEHVRSLCNRASFVERTTASYSSFVQDYLSMIAKVDPTRFQQVVRNIVANALKVSPAGAEIVVQGHITDDRRICISVRDQGAGVPTDELEKIFEAFVQSSTSKDGSGGTGLGLAICKKIIDAHGGSIVADNILDGGAAFSIFLPSRQNLYSDTIH